MTIGMRRFLRTRLSLRLTRRKLQIRAALKWRELTAQVDRTACMAEGPILFSTVRNEVARLPFFLEYYRRLGVEHFLFVDNASTDGTGALLAAQPDVSLWHTAASYRAARFGVDWLNALLMRYGTGRWALVADPDEFLVFPHCDTRGLPALTRWLDDCGRESLGVLLLDLYGRDAIEHTRCRPGEDPVRASGWFDSGNYVITRDSHYQNLWIQGGPRMRAFFADDPSRAPALNKIPLVRWHRGFVYRNGAHDLLPRRLNRTYCRDGGSVTSGVLLHAKFMDVLVGKVDEEMERRQHYANGAEYTEYAGLRGGVRLWTPHSQCYRDWRQLCALGLMARGGWL